MSHLTFVASHYLAQGRKNNLSSILLKVLAGLAVMRHVLRKRNRSLECMFLCTWISPGEIRKSLE